MNNFNLIIYKNLSLYNTLQELNNFFTYELKGHVEDLDNLIKITNQNSEFLVITDKKINNKINLRNKARENKDYKEADRIRDELSDKGVLIEDKDGKTLWKFK